MMQRPDFEAYLRWPWFRPWYYKPLLYDRFLTPYGMFPQVPDLWPVLAKPVFNFEGVGKGIKLCRNKDELEALPGYLWMELLQGPHISVDVDRQLYAMDFVRGQVKEPGVFEYWERVPIKRDLAGKALAIRHQLDPNNEIAVINLEFIGETLIEAHARPAEEFDLLKHGAICAPVWARVERQIAPGQDSVLTDVLSDMSTSMTFRPTLEDGWPDIGPHGWYRYGLLYGQKLDGTREIARRLHRCIENMESTNDQKRP